MKKFSSTFWSANFIELLERAAYYAVASFVVIYLYETLKMDPVTSTFLNGTILWGLLYFLPPLSGTIADKYGFKNSLIFCFILLFVGYLILGNVQKIWISSNFTIPVTFSILLIGIGGSFVKPCISGTVQKTASFNPVLGFGIFYMTINIGSMIGRIISYNFRIRFGIPSIFSIVATSFALLAFLSSIFIYKEPKSDAKEKPKTLKEAILSLFLVLKNLKFVFFLLSIGFFWAIYVQIYNLIPLFLRFVDKNAPVELYTLINPVMIVSFQLLITKITKNLNAIISIIIGIIVTIAGISFNLIPPIFNLDISKSTFLLNIPIGGFFILISIASMAIGEMLTSPRVYQYIGSISPKGKEGLYLGYANLPLAFGTIIGAPLGGWLFKIFIEKPHNNNLEPKIFLLWLTVSILGIISLFGVIFYNIYLKKK